MPYILDSLCLLGLRCCDCDGALMTPVPACSCSKHVFCFTHEIVDTAAYVVVHVQLQHGMITEPIWLQRLQQQKQSTVLKFMSVLGRVRLHSTCAQQLER